ncbi:MAG: serine/threonine protein kinase [Myxococcaceae bacterium]|nr:serine/threonine protein kinase [Myxococcaceae bacterium]MCI0669830.1 serine/threonine protein kinase [Myxococcaceae bacterium]
MPPSSDSTTVRRPRLSSNVPGYRLEKLVGRGGMGEVHRAVQLSLGRTVAVKILATELAQEPSFVSRFRKEAAALAALSHPNVVAVVDQGDADGVPYLVMEFVDGPSLREVMRAPLFDTQSALRIFHEVARAIAYAHGRGIIHRDLKPENILFAEQAGGIAKVSDFGLAGFLEEGSGRFALTQTHMSMGTVAYMAPEQRLDAKNVDGRADIYALGVVLYEMVTGEVPMGTFDPPSQRRAGLDPRLDGIIARCLKPIPEERFPSVSALLAEMEPLLPADTRSNLPPRSTRVQRARVAAVAVGRMVGRAAAALLVLAAVGVLGLDMLRARNAKVPAPEAAVLGGPLGSPMALGAQGRMESGGRWRQVSLGAGPDLVPLLASGRAVRQEGEALVFDAPVDEARAGRVVVDTLEPESEWLEWVAVARAATPPEDWMATTRRVVFGPRPPAQVGLLLMGDPGRFVALVVSEHEGEARLEWALGERRGAQLIPVSMSAQQPLRMEMEISTEGELRAFLGAERNRRPVGEPLQLGEDWQRLFGRLPQAALGCLEGECRFDGLRFSVRRPGAPVVPAVAVEKAAPTPAVTKRPAPPPAPAPKRTPPRKRR